jgi:hypothetical protein
VKHKAISSFVSIFGFYTSYFFNQETISMIAEGKFPKMTIDTDIGDQRPTEIIEILYSPEKTSLPINISKVEFGV